MSEQTLQQKKQQSNAFFTPAGTGTFFSPVTQQKQANSKVTPIQKKDTPKGIDKNRHVRNQTTTAGTILQYEAFLRKVYIKSDKAIYDQAQAMLKRGGSKSEVAKWANLARNEAKVKIRKWDLDVVRLLAERRNKARYGNKVGPSYEQLRKGDPAKNVRPKTDTQIVESAKKTNPKANKWAGRFRIAGRILIAIDIGIGVYNVAQHPIVEWPKEGLKEAGGIAGAAAGGLAGAKLVGAAGGVIGGFFGGVGAPIGAGIGALIGGIGGAIGGAIAGRAAGKFVANKLFPVKETRFEGSFK